MRLLFSMPYDIDLSSEPEALTLAQNVIFFTQIIWAIFFKLNESQKKFSLSDQRDIYKLVCNSVILLHKLHFHVIHHLFLPLTGLNKNDKQEIEN